MCNQSRRGLTIRSLVFTQNKIIQPALREFSYGKRSPKIRSSFTSSRSSPLRLDRDLYHAVGLGREELVRFFYLIQREPVGNELAEINTLVLHEVHQPSHPLLQVRHRFDRPYSLRLMQL